MNKLALFVPALCFYASVASIAGWAMPQQNEVNALVDLDLSYLEHDIGFRWGMDPFIKKAGFMVKDPDKEGDIEWQLEAILWDSKKPAAIINGQSVSEGGFVGSGRVERIGESYVVLRDGKSMYELILQKVSSDRAPASEEPSVLSIEETKSEK